MQGNKLRVVLGVGLLASVLVVSGCGPKSGSTEAKAKALASSTPNAQAINTVKADLTKCVNSVPVAELLSKTKRAQVGTCISTLVTPAQRQQIEQCAFNAALKDHVLTPSGRKKFKTTDVGKCIDATIAPAKTAVPKTTPSK